MRFKILSLAAGALLLSAGAASAAIVTNPLHLRAGPGVSYGVIETLPAGADVDVLGCADGWCRVDWRGEVGYASADYLAGGGYAPPPPPPPVYYEPAPYYYAPGPVFSFGFGWGGGWHGGHHWHGGGHHWHGHGGGHHHHHH